MTFLTAALAFLRGNWRWLLPSLAAGVLAVLLWIRTDQRDDARASDRLHVAQHQAYRASVRALSAQMRANFAESARRQQAEQARISQEASRDYQARIAQLRAEYDRLRNRPAGPGNTRPPGVPPLPGGPGRPDGPATDQGLSLWERLVASEQAEQLIALQRWVREQAAVAPVGTEPAH